jgi:hypothetical protein
MRRSGNGRLRNLILGHPIRSAGQRPTADLPRLLSVHCLYQTTTLGDGRNGLTSTPTITRLKPGTMNDAHPGRGKYHLRPHRLVGAAVIWLLVAGAALIAAGCLLRVIAERKAEVLGIADEVVYSDADGVGDLLTSDRHGLVGKPDYITRDGDELVPTERKSRDMTSAGV